MGDPVSTALIVSAVAGTAAGVYGVVSAKEQKKDAKAEANRQKEEQRKRESELAAQKERDELAKAQISRHRSAVGSSVGKGIRSGGTVLTSPLGVVSSPTAGAKTLLGQ